MADIKGETCPQKWNSLKKESCGSKTARKHIRYEKFVSKGTMNPSTSFLSTS